MVETAVLSWTFSWTVNLGGVEVVAATGAYQPAQLLRMTAAGLLARLGVSSGCVLSK